MKQRKYSTIFLTILMLALQNSCHGMNFVSAMKDNFYSAKEWWDHSEWWGGKGLVVGVATYVLLTEWRNRWNKVQIRELKEKHEQEKAESRNTKKVIALTTIALFDTNFDKIAGNLSGHYRFLSADQRNTLLTDPEEAKKYYQYNLDGLKRGFIAKYFNADDSPVQKLGRRFDAQELVLGRVTRTLYKLGLRDMNGTGSDLLNQKFEVEISRVFDGKLKAVENRINGVENHWRSLEKEGLLDGIPPIESGHDENNDKEKAH